jgi:hypothetical protein
MATALIRKLTLQKHNVWLANNLPGMHFAKKCCQVNLMIENH